MKKQPQQEPQSIQLARQMEVVRENLGVHQAVMMVEALEQHIANDDETALKILHVLAIRSTMGLRRATERQPEAVRKLARRATLWPMMSGPFPALFKRQQEFFETLELGRESIAPLFDTKKLFKTQTPARTWGVETVYIIADIREKHLSRGLNNFQYQGISLYNRILLFDYDEAFARICMSLPELKRSTLKTWLPAIRHVIQILTDGKPELAPQLKTMGAYRKKHKAGGQKTQEYSLMEGILFRIQEALATTLRS